jgi:hypothetical protein
LEWIEPDVVTWPKKKESDDVNYTNIRKKIFQGLKDISSIKTKQKWKQKLIYLELK